MTSEIVAFVKARLDDDERVARAAMDGVGVQTGDPWSGVWSAAGGYQPGLIEDSGGGVVVYDEGSPSEGQAVHIARHDPARVLREVRAKRAILADYERYAAERRRAMNGWWEGDRDPSPILLALALPYSDHEDFREEWHRVDR